MSNEDKTQFEFIERPGSPNKRLRPSSRSSSRPNSSKSIIKMWVLFEGGEDAEKFVLKEDDFENYDEFLRADLDDFKRLLRKRYPFLEDTGNKDIALFNENLERYDPATNLNSLDVGESSATKIIVRYPISAVNIKVTFVYGQKQGKREIPHTSGSFNQLQALVREIFKDLEEGTIYFVNDGTEIWNAYNFNTVVKSQTAQNNNVELKLKVLIEGRKKYSDWKPKEVFRDILGKPNCSSVSQIPKFEMTELPKLDPPFTQDELNMFLGELRNTLKSFEREFDNETKNRVYINAFMKTAVCYFRDTKKKSVLLDVEKPLSGSKGYGPIDYWVTFIEVLLLLCEAKAEDMNQGVAQVIAQMHSAIEQLRNCNEEPTIYGIATTGKTWRFVRWVGSSEMPTVHVSEEYTCSYTDNMEREKEVLEYIAQILQSQVESVCNDEGSHPSKRQCASQRK